MSPVAACQFVPAPDCCIEEVGGVAVEEFGTFLFPGRVLPGFFHVGQFPPALVEEVLKLTHVQYCGLMTSAPPVDDPEKVRGCFRDLRQLGVDIKQKNLNNVTGTSLSMGMSQDYRVAVEEGATHVRVGTGIFGARIYNKP